MEVPPSRKNMLSSFEEQDKLSSETIEVSQRWSLYLHYSQTGHNEIWNVGLNFILEVKVNHLAKQQGS